MAPLRRKAVRRGQPLKGKKPHTGGARASARDRSSGSSNSGSTRSSDEDDDGSDSSDDCSDEDDPRDYKRGGYHPVSPYQFYNGRYRVLSKLGAGAFSTVWLCADEKTAADRPEGPELVAMKVCKSKKSVTEQAEDEILLLEQMSKKSQPDQVVQMRGHFWHSGPNGRHKCMVFEVMGENLLALVKHHDYNGLPLNMVRRLALHTLKGLEYIHARGVIHTDVKLENVLIQRHDLAELAQEACKAHRAFTAQREATGALSKSQKKRMKKKAKNAKPKDGDEDADAVDDAPQATSTSAEAPSADVNGTGTAEANEDDQADHAAAQALGRPVPPVRQRDRFDTLETDQVFAKLADFGNGCLADRKVTDDIQTRQYRSPEVIIGTSWDASADVWSAACMIFELVTGDFLFDPRTGEDWSRDEDHLALMTELIGNLPPKEWALSGKYAKDLFSREGKLKHISKLKFWTLTDVLEEKYSMLEEEAKEVASFLLPMLTWLPTTRQSAKEALKHPWLQKVDEEDDDDDETETATENADDEEQHHDTVREAKDRKPAAPASDETTSSQATTATLASADSASSPTVDLPPAESTSESKDEADAVDTQAAATKGKALKSGKGVGNVGVSSASCSSGGGYPAASASTAAPTLVPAPPPLAETPANAISSDSKDAALDQPTDDADNDDQEDVDGGEAKKKKKNKKKGKK